MDEDLIWPREGLNQFQSATEENYKIQIIYKAEADSYSDPVSDDKISFVNATFDSLEAAHSRCQELGKDLAGINIISDIKNEIEDKFEDDFPICLALVVPYGLDDDNITNINTGEQERLTDRSLFPYQGSEYYRKLLYTPVTQNFIWVTNNQTCHAVCVDKKIEASQELDSQYDSGGFKENIIYKGKDAADTATVICVNYKFGLLLSELDLKLTGIEKVESLTTMTRASDESVAALFPVVANNPVEANSVCQAIHSGIHYIK